jgi:hypothetical protein
VTATPHQIAAAAHWLAAASSESAQVNSDWQEWGLALMPVGRLWDVVKVLAVDEGSEMAAAGFMGCGIDGPVILDPHSGVHYLLVPRGTAETWSVPGTECLGDACYLGVPFPSRLSPPGCHWVIPPDGSGVLVDPQRLHAALEAVPAP